MTLSVIENTTNKPSSQKTPIKEHPAYGSHTPIAYGDLRNIQGISREPIWGGILKAGDAVELVGKPETGKSTFTYIFIIQLLLERMFLGHQSFKQLKVCLIDGELPIEDIKAVIETIRGQLSPLEQVKLDSLFYAITKEMSGALNPLNLCIEGPNSELMEMLKSFDVVVIDSLKTNTIGSNISKSEEIQTLLANLQALKMEGVTLIYLNHCTKQGAALGSVEFDILNDIRFMLKNVSDDPMRMILELGFEKGRIKPVDKQSLTFEIHRNKPGIPITHLKTGAKPVSLIKEQQFA